jgi:hypothetical protein
VAVDVKCSVLFFAHVLSLHFSNAQDCHQVDR